METEFLNYKTHPDLKIYDAIHMSCSLPIIFDPIKINGNFYIDGGLYANAPIQIVLQENTNLNEIFICCTYDNKCNNINDDNVIFYIGSVLKNIINSSQKITYTMIESKYLFRIKHIDETIIKIKDPNVKKKSMIQV